VVIKFAMLFFFLSVFSSFFFFIFCGLAHLTELLGRVFPQDSFGG